MKSRYLGTFAAGLVLVAACGGGSPATQRPATGAPATAAPATAAPATAAPATAAPATQGGGGTIETVKIGVDLPLSGASVANGGPTLKGIELAVAEWNEMGHSYTVELNVQDDAVNGVYNPEQGASNAHTLVADEEVVGMVGPFNSSVARAIIPITNEFGLSQCSPANTATDLTKEGSEVYRPANPDQRNYFRVATPDDIQGPAGAAYAYNDLGKRAALIIDDTTAFGVGVADTFEAEFQELGGTIVDRVSNDYAVNTSFSAILTAAGSEFDVVYFGGTQTLGGGQLRRDMGAAGLLDITLVGPDGITDLADAGGEGAFLTLAGPENGANVHGTVAGIHDIPDPEAFAEAYGAANNGEAPGAYSALAYACTQVLLQAIDANIGEAADLAALREAVRTDIFAGAEWETVLGTINFDENGDSSQKFISFYKTTDDGQSWEFVKQQDFGESAQ